MLGRDGRTPATAPSTAQYAALGDFGWIYCTVGICAEQGLESLVELGNKEATMDTLYFKVNKYNTLKYIYLFTKVHNITMVNYCDNKGRDF